MPRMHPPRQGEHRLRELWRDRSGDGRLGLDCFEVEDEAVDVEFTGWDPSDIEATPDSLIADCVGLQVFLRHCNDIP